MGVINTLELEGASQKSWGDAAREALREAAKTIRHINRLEVLGTSTRVEEGRIAEAGRGTVRVDSEKEASVSTTR